MKLQVVRKVTTSECMWLGEDIKKGSIVFRYNGHTYGCISPSGVACCMEEEKTPFFELPSDAIKIIVE